MAAETAEEEEEEEVLISEAELPARCSVSHGRKICNQNKVKYISFNSSPISSVTLLIIPFGDKLSLITSKISHICKCLHGL